jgi:hypothetical protein
MTPLDSRLENAISFLVRSQLGDQARWHLYDRSSRSPMNFVLEEADRRLGNEVVVVWVEGGYPQLSAFTGLARPVIVYSTRYVELTAYLRGLLVEEWIANRRVEEAERAFLTILSEFALLGHNPQLAGRLFLRSKLGSAIYRTYRGILPGLEAEPISERYMAAWFFGLVHELGHSDEPSPELTETGLLSSEALEESLLESLATFDFAAEVDLAGILDRIRANNHDHPLGVDHLRGEAVADLFAASVLLQATVDILRALEPPKALDAAHYVAEVYFYLNVIAALQRCNGVVRAASAQQPKPEEMELILLEPAAIGVRLELVKMYLVFSLAAYYSDSDVPTDEEVADWRDLTEQVMASFSSAVEELDSGLANAMRTVFWDEEPLAALLSQAADELKGDPLFKLDVQAFCELAQATGAEDASLAALAALAE